MSRKRGAVYTGTLTQLEDFARSVRLHNLLFGWWGVPWGLFWTPAALMSNAEAMKQIRQAAQQPATSAAAVS
jgi:hypothetical protein